MIPITLSIIGLVLCVTALIGFRWLDRCEHEWRLLDWHDLHIRCAKCGKHRRLPR